MPIIYSPQGVDHECGILFHYTDSKSLLNIFRTQQLQCTQYKYFFTEQDNVHFSNILGRVLASDEECQYIYSTLLSSYALLDHLNSYSYFIASFSKYISQNKIWERWPDGNSFNIGIRIKYVTGRNATPLNDMNIVNVVYDDNEKIKVLTEFILNQPISRYQELLRAEGDPDAKLKPGISRFNIENDFTLGLFDLSMRMKHASLKEEEEILLILKEPVPLSDKRNFKIDRQGDVVEYTNLKLCFEKDVELYSGNPANTDRQSYWLESLLSHSFNSVENEFISKRLYHIAKKSN